MRARLRFHRLAQIPDELFTSRSLASGSRPVVTAGQVHRIEFRIKRGKIQLRCFRDQRATKTNRSKKGKVMKIIGRLLGLSIALALSVSAQTKDPPDLGNRALVGPSVWVLDSGGQIRAADLGPTLALDPPGTAGGRYSLRCIVPASTGGAAIRQKIITVAFTGGVIALPDTPLAGTTPLVFWGSLLQPPSKYTVAGPTITLLGAGWQTGDQIVVVYFW